MTQPLGPLTDRPRRRRRVAAPDQRRSDRVVPRPLEGDRTEVVRVIEFLWPAGDAVQPVLLVERELLQ
jgi:hypothetical protein